MDADAEAGLARVEEVPPEPGETKALEVSGRNVLVCNLAGELFAVENLCSHARVPLTEARLVDGELECPVHGARFDVRSGTAMCRPARRPLRTFGVERVDGGMTIRLN